MNEFSRLAQVDGPPATYDRVARAYQMLHGRWLRAGGAEAFAAVQGSVAAEVTPRSRVLDAGCGTGLLARRVAETEPGCELTLIDAAPRMLARAADIPGDHRIGDIRSLPFPDDFFDIVASSWVIETLGGDRSKAIHELIRVLKPGGLLCYCVCSAPSSRWAALLSYPVRLIIHRLFHGEFLDQSKLVDQSCAGAHVLRFRGGLATVVVWRKDVT